MSERPGDDPRAPHWFDFRKVNDEPNDWTFEVVEWNDEPDAEGVVDRGEAEVVRGDHRFVVSTWLQERERTHDRYWGVAYETVNQDGEPEPLAYHISTSQAIARNNLSHGRDAVGREDTTPHVVVRDHHDGPRETFEYPCESLAEKACDLQHEVKAGDPERNYMATVHSKAEWQDKLSLERSIAERDSA